MIFNVKRYHLIGIIQIYFLIIITITTCLTKIKKYQFMVLFQLFDNIIKKYSRHQTFFVCNKFVPSLHNNRITISKLIAQICLIFVVGALKQAVLTSIMSQKPTYFKNNFLPKFWKTKSHGRDEEVPHTTYLLVSSFELICSLDFSKLLFRRSLSFSINIKASIITKNYL